MKRLLAALAALLLAVVPVKAAKAADPFLTLDTPAPYHYGGTAEVTAHGVIPKDRGELTTNVQMMCRQASALVYSEVIGHVVADTPYTLHFGQSGFSQWDINGGGAADCRIRFYFESHNRPADIWTEIDFTVDA